MPKKQASCKLQEAPFLGFKKQLLEILEANLGSQALSQEAASQTGFSKMSFLESQGRKNIVYRKKRNDYEARETRREIASTRPTIRFEAEAREEINEHEESRKKGKDSEPRISRKEGEKVIFPSWPKFNDLDHWKATVITNALSICADPDHTSWITWLEEAFMLKPDIEALVISGQARFCSIHLELSNALMAMVASSGENAREVLMEIKMKTRQICCSPENTCMK